MAQAADPEVGGQSAPGASVRLGWEGALPQHLGAPARCQETPTDILNQCLPLS